MFPSILVIYMIFQVKAFLTDIRYDDGYFYELTTRYSYFEYIVMRYKTWSGRLVGDSLSYFLSIFGIWSYRILALLSYLLSISSICRIVSGKISKKLWLLTSLLFGIIYFSTLTSAVFWFNGGSYYLVPVSCGLYLLSVFTDYYFYNISHISKSKIFFSFVSIIVAFFSNEQISMVVLLICTSFIVLQVFMGRKNKLFFLALMVFMFFCLLISLLSPGNRVRLISEEHWYPGFNQIPLSSKIKVGIFWFFDSIVNKLIVFSYISVFVIYKQAKKYKLNKLCLILLGMQLGLIFANKLLMNYFIDFSTIYNFTFIKDVYLESLEYTANRLGFVALLVKLYPYIFWSLFYTNIFFLLEKISKRKTFFLILLIAALGSLCMMWFTPTIFVSGNRVLYVYSIIFVIILTGLINDMKLDIISLCVLLVLFLSNMLPISFNWINYGFKVYY